MPKNAPSATDPNELQKRLDTVNSKLRTSELLLSVSQKIAGLKNLSEILWTIIETTTETLNADRGSLFLNDPLTGELYSRVAQGELIREIRILNSTGIAGSIFQSGVGEIIHDAYADDRFNSKIDEQTGYVTKNIVCAPVKTVRGDVIGVIQILNKKRGRFTKEDLEIVQGITLQAAVSLQNAQGMEEMVKSREKEMKFLDVVAEVTSEIELGSLLQRVMVEATKMLNADRATLFLNDFKTNELFSRVAMGEGIGEIRLPNNAGIAGAVFQSRETINIPHAYADLRFNPGFDKQTGYFTRSILCVPIINKDGECIGCTQALNKKGGGFTDEDESRLKAFTQQVSIALENAKLFEDVAKERAYNYSMLTSMSNAVITINDEGKIITCNKSGLKILKIRDTDILGKTAEEFFTNGRSWILERIKHCDEEKEPEFLMDAEIEVGSEQDDNVEIVSANVSFLPLENQDPDGRMDQSSGHLGTMIMVEDISDEKRMKSTMSRYIDPNIADQLMSDGSDIMGGQETIATVLFSDVRSFTTITEALGAQGTVALLNEYFDIMVEAINEQGGMVDKFIGDAIMAGFGIPFPHEDDEDRGVRAGINMIKRLWDWNKQREKDGKMPIDMGLGLNTDKLLSGNIGSSKRMDYTMIGDGVNLAARLESACKSYAARILISDFTYQKLKGTYQIRYIDDVVVKGKTEAIGVREVLDYHTPETFPNLMDTVNHFNEGRIAFKAGDWDKGIRSFNECLKANPNDKLSKIYIGRCDTMKQRNPKDWDGIWVMETK
ncbi:MAG: GAF domain-containing protein [Oceanospirillales bacterium TMED33]|nr:adenylate/guanylate cyclase domain-containing protein [Gammaproteobacteria bacterium]RPG20597.1 MAG: GAF domain-containing protein [Oceanospirillales bacterium TMED33]CAI8314138.1 MAG: Adenylate cyclase 1 [Gammaproteobacteria bacterium]